MIIPDKSGAGADDNKPHSNEQCVPTAALAIDGTAPAQGDEVEYTVRGRIARVEGGKSYVTPETINDQPAAVEEEKSPEDMSDEDMMAAAKKADDEDDGY